MLTATTANSSTISGCGDNSRRTNRVVIGVLRRLNKYPIDDIADDVTHADDRGGIRDETFGKLLLMRLHHQAVFHTCGKS